MAKKLNEIPNQIVDPLRTFLNSLSLATMRMLPSKFCLLFFSKLFSEPRSDWKRSIWWKMAEEKKKTEKRGLKPDWNKVTEVPPVGTEHSRIRYQQLTDPEQLIHIFSGVARYKNGVVPVEEPSFFFAIFNG